MKITIVKKEARVPGETAREQTRRMDTITQPVGAGAEALGQAIVAAAEEENFVLVTKEGKMRGMFIPADIEQWSVLMEKLDPSIKEAMPQADEDLAAGRSQTIAEIEAETPEV